MSGGLEIGQYTYPFSFLLPASMPASFELDGSNYIRYQLSACLPNFENHSQDQAYQIPLQVREPPKQVGNRLRGEAVK